MLVYEGAKINTQMIHVWSRVGLSTPLVILFINTIFLFSFCHYNLLIIISFIKSQTEGYSGSDLTALARDAALGPIRGEISFKFPSVCLTSQSASEKLNQEKKSPQTFAHLVNGSAMFDNQTLLSSS